MTLTGSGQLSIGDIASEKSIAQSNVSLQNVSTTSINAASSSKPDGATPHAISEFYSYDHNASGGYYAILLYDLASGTNCSLFTGTNTYYCDTATIGAGSYVYTNSNGTGSVTGRFYDGAGSIYTVTASLAAFDASCTA